MELCVGRVIEEMEERWWTRKGSKGAEAKEKAKEAICSRNR